MDDEQSNNYQLSNTIKLNNNNNIQLLNKTNNNLPISLTLPNFPHLFELSFIKYISIYSEIFVQNPNYSLYFEDYKQFFKNYLYYLLMYYYHSNSYGTNQVKNTELTGSNNSKSNMECNELLALEELNKINFNVKYEHFKLASEDNNTKNIITNQNETKHVENNCTSKTKPELNNPLSFLQFKNNHIEGKFKKLHNQEINRLNEYILTINQNNYSDSDLDSSYSNTTTNSLKTDENNSTNITSSSSKSIRLKTILQKNSLLENEDLAKMYKFANYFKLRRLSLGLTQTQIGTSLNAKEGSAYSQSAICRFEKLDVTLKSAKRMKPVLQKWLTETETLYERGIRKSIGTQLLHRSSRKRKRRTCFSPCALNCLLDQLEKNPYPTKNEMTELAKSLTYEREVIRVWFCNRRQTMKSNQLLSYTQ